MILVVNLVSDTYLITTNSKRDWLGSSSKSAYSEDEPVIKPDSSSEKTIFEDEMEWK